MQALFFTRIFEVFPPGMSKSVRRYEAMVKEKVYLFGDF